MNRFEKVTFKQFLKDTVEDFPTDGFVEDDYEELYKAIRDVYDALVPPSRATKYSSGYDFHSPITFSLEPNEIIKIPTGFKCRVDSDKWLMIIPKSSMGFKHNIRLINQVGNIDSDYYNNKGNEGHIWIGLQNQSQKTWQVNQGDGIGQGIILPYFKTVDDESTEEREGGIGSTR